MVSPDYRIVLGLLFQPLQGGLFIFLYRHLYRRTLHIRQASSEAKHCRLHARVGHTIEITTMTLAYLLDVLEPNAL